MLRWAFDFLNISAVKSVFEVGIVAPFYVYMNYKEELHQLLQLSSSAVALGATAKIKAKLGWSISQGNLTGNIMIDSKSVPSDVAVEFSIFMSSEGLADYVSTLESLGVSQIVFAYPQDYSLETIRELEGFFKKTKNQIRLG